MQTIIDNLINEFTNCKTNDKAVFSKKEIIAIIKKVTEGFASPIIESNGVVANPINYTITIKDYTYTLRKKEFMLLYYLMSNKNKLLRREKLLNDIWGTDVVVGERTVDVHIRKIRSIIGNDLIETRKSYGYCWNEK